MTTNPYPLKEAEYREWVNAHLPSEELGTCHNAELCALAQFLSTKYSQPFQVTWEETVRKAWYEPMKTGERFLLPAWAKTEASFFDSIHGEMVPVTKGSYDHHRVTQK